jgi:hypothetical protein
MSAFEGKADLASRIEANLMMGPTGGRLLVLSPWQRGTSYGCRTYIVPVSYGHSFTAAAQHCWWHRCRPNMCRGSAVDGTPIVGSGATIAFFCSLRCFKKCQRRALTIESPRRNSRSYSGPSKFPEGAVRFHSDHTWVLIAGGGEFVLGSIPTNS